MECQTSQLSAKDLESAFAAFNSASGTLVEQYKSLEQHVTALTGELGRANNARQKELAEKQQLAHRLAGILAALPAGVLVFGGQGRLQNWNQKAADLLGIELNNQTWQQLTKLCLTRGVSKTGEVRLANGRNVMLSIQMLPEGDGRIVLLNDVTESQNLAEGWRHKERLSEIGEMMGRLAHQIRTPLSSAFLYLSRLNKKCGPEQNLKAVNKLHYCLNSVQKTLDDLLLYIKGQNPVMEYCDITTLLNSVRTAFIGVLNNSAFVFDFIDYTNNRRIFINRHALEGALLNLLRNAMEAGASSIVLVVKDNDQATQLIVEDNGPGVGVDKQQQIFNAFYTTRTNGTGLGLAIVRNVMELHGGSVRVDPGYRQGARFILELPEYKAERFLPAAGARSEKMCVE